MIENYDLREIIYESELIKIYRGYRTNSIDSLSPPTIIGKTVNENHSDRLLAKKIKNEYEILRFLEHPNIVKVYQLETYNSMPILVMEDIPYGTLSNYLISNSLNLQQFLEISITLCNILEYLHSQSIIHKDINPHNILYNPTLKILKLIDFNISQKVSSSITGNKYINRLEGNPYYLSPEQTGRLNRAPDYRTDFYSLGITFYEMLTRKRPFSGKNAMEIIHAHIAKKADDLTKYNKQVPQILSEIVQKLMEKNPEQRYHSARGIRVDLETCLEHYKSQGVFFSFSLGTKDVFDKLILPERIVGRDSELSHLHDVYTALREEPEQAQIVQIIGKSGIGKTSLIKSFSKSLNTDDAFFLSGKYEQLSQSPLLAFIEMLHNLIEQITNLPIYLKTHLLEQMKLSLNENGKIITDLVPEMETIIGVQTNLEELSQKESENRFFYTIKLFLESITSSGFYLILFFDDIQWMDSASINLLNFIKKEIGRTLIIVSYRTKEIHLNQNVIELLNQIDQEEKGHSKLYLYHRKSRLDDEPSSRTHRRYSFFHTREIEPNAFKRIIQI